MTEQKPYAPQSYTYPNPPAMPAAGPPGGGLPWGLSLLALVPFLGPLTALIIAITLYAGRRAHPHPVYAENARTALNWQLTLTAFWLLGALCLYLETKLFADLVLLVGLDAAHLVGGLLLMPMLVSIFLAWVPHLVFCIMGLVRARSGSAFVPPLAIPFFGRRVD